MLVILGDAGINYWLNERDRALKERLSRLPVTLQICSDKARNMMRKGTVEYGITVSSEAPDSYLDDLLALRWRRKFEAMDHAMGRQEKIRR